MKVCFVCPEVYPLLHPDAVGGKVRGAIGGSEYRMLRFARSLASRGHDVSMVVWDPGPVDEDADPIADNPITDRQTADGISVLIGPRKQFIGGWLGRVNAEVRESVTRKAGFPWVTSVPWRWRLLWQLPFALLYHVLYCFQRWWRDRFDTLTKGLAKAYARSGADVFIAVGANEVAAGAVRHATAAGKRSVLLLANDYDLDELHTRDSRTRDRFHQRCDRCKQAIDGADAIVAQTPRQQSLLKERFSRDATVIANPIDLSSQAEPINESDVSQSPFALWVGKSGAAKRPERLVELAKRCPDIPFVMVMNRLDAAVFDRMTQAVAALPSQNVELIERVPVDRIERYFAGAKLFISTASVEGFPNTFLQAGKYRVPICSLDVDPNHIITQHGAGTLAGGDDDRFAEQVEQLWEDAPARQQHGEAIRGYVEKHHAMDACVDALLEALEQTVGSLSLSARWRAS